MINRKTMLTQAIENGFDQTTEGYPNTLKYCKEKNAYDYTIYGNCENLLPCPSEITWTGTKRINVNIPAGEYALYWSSRTAGGNESPVILFYTNNAVHYITEHWNYRIVKLTEPETTIYLYSVGYSNDYSKGITSTVNGLILCKNDGKNLINPVEYSKNKTYHGLNFNVDENGIITISGAIDTSGEVYVGDWYVFEKKVMPSGTYTLTGCPTGGGTYTYRLFVQVTDLDGTPHYYSDTGNGVTFSIEENWSVYITIRIGGQLGTVENLVFKPQLERGATATEFEPYKYKGVGDKTVNLLPYPYAQTTKTECGITFTDNGDGRVTLNGTATENIVFYFFKDTSKLIEGINQGDTVTFSIIGFNNFANASFCVNYYDVDGKQTTGFILNASTRTKTLEIPDTWYGMEVYVVVLKDRTVTNVTVPPMIQKGAVARAYEPYGYKIPLTVQGENLIDPDVLLPQQGWVKQEDGSFYVANASTPYQKKLWENTEGYTGQIKVTYLFKYLKSNEEAAASGDSITMVYTDGTKTSIWLSANKWNAMEWMKPANTYMVSNKNKTVDYLVWKYGTGGNSTWVRDIVISKVTDTLPREYAIFRNAPLKNGENINYKADSLPDLLLDNETNIITTYTTIQPSNISVTYNSKVK